MGVGGKAPTFGTTTGIGGSITFDLTVGIAAIIGGNAAVFGTTWICGTTPTVGTVGMVSISGRMAMGTIDGFNTTGMPGTTIGATGAGREQDVA
jgi:hypothetical protein